MCQTWTCNFCAVSSDIVLKKKFAVTCADVLNRCVVSCGSGEEAAWIKWGGSWFMFLKSEQLHNELRLFRSVQEEEVSPKMLDCSFKCEIRPGEFTWNHFVLCQSITGQFSDGGVDEVEVNCSLEKNQFILFRGDKGRRIPLKVRHWIINPPSNIWPGDFIIYTPPLYVSEGRLLSHQTPVSHRGSCNPIGHPAAWSGCGRGHPPADSQWESFADSQVEGASYISQRLGSSRSDAYLTHELTSSRCLCVLTLLFLVSTFWGGHLELDETVNIFLLIKVFFVFFLCVYCVFMDGLWDSGPLDTGT